MTQSASVKSHFNMLDIDAWLEDGQLRGRAGGMLGHVAGPMVEVLFSKLNTLKVIARKDGCNVYNLYNPPMPTSAGLRFLTRRLRSILEKKPFPVTANLSITQRCQCKCVHCSADPFTNAERRELTADEIKTVVDGTLDLEANLVIFVGGEPTIHKDLPELIRYVDKSKAIVMIFTNGYNLERDAETLAEAGLFSLNISVDSCVPAQHDEWRGIKGLYERALAGARKARECGILTGISTYATKETLEGGQVETLLKLAQDEGFQETTVFDCIPSGKFLKDTSKILTPDEKKRLIELCDKFHESDHPMGVNCMAKINSPLGVGCYGATSQFYMTAYGDINPCDFNPISFGNVLEMPIEVIWYKMTSHPDFDHRFPSCRMQTPAYRAKYIDPLPDAPQLPIPIEHYENEPPLTAYKKEPKA